MALQITGNDRFGSTLISLSGSSNTFSWSPFGSSSTRTGAAASLPGFNGERQDPLSGVTHLGNGYRAFSPALRRFTCPDSESPFGVGGINAYVYCGHDPVNTTDHSGHMPGNPKKEKQLLMEEGMTREQASSMATQRVPLEAKKTKRAAAPQAWSTIAGAKPPANRRDVTKEIGEDSEPINYVTTTQLPLKGGEKKEFDYIYQLTSYQAWNSTSNRPRNIAFMDVALKNGERGTLISISGQKVIIPTVTNLESDKRLYKTLTIGHDRTFDSEAKLLKYFTRNHPDHEIEGVISIHSELEICNSCKHVIQQFKDKYPNIIVHSSAQNKIYRNSPEQIQRRLQY